MRTAMRARGFSAFRFRWVLVIWRMFSVRRQPNLDHYDDYGGKTSCC